MILENFSAKILPAWKCRTSALIKSLIHLFVMLRLHYHDWRGAGFGCRKMKKMWQGLGTPIKVYMKPMEAYGAHHE